MRKKLYLLFFILLITLEIYPQWVQTNGPYGGTVSCFAVSSYGSGSTNLFATTSGGVYLSTNNGTSWTPANTPFSGFSEMVEGGENLFAGTDNGIYRSTDNGKNWTRVNNGFGSERSDYAVGPLAVNDTNLFAATYYGVFLSTNNGTSWIKKSSGLMDVPHINSIVATHSKGESNNLFVSTIGGVYLSTNNGTNWIGANTPFSYFSEMIEIGENLFAGARGGVFLSTDNGKSWTAVNNGLPTNDIIPFLVYTLAVSGTNIFAGSGGLGPGGVFLSSNNGNSWAEVNNGLPKLCYDSTACGEIKALAVSSMYLFAGTDKGVFRSTNNGTNWSIANTGLPNTTVLSLAVSPDGTGGTNIFAGLDGGVCISTNNGISWTDISTGLTGNYVSSLIASPNGKGGTNLFAGTESHSWFDRNVGVFLSTNNGVSWTEIDSGLTDYSIHALAVVDTNLFAGTSAGVFLSTNNGTSWIKTSLSNYYVLSLAFKGTDLFAGTSNGVCFSTNNGTSWIEAGLKNIAVQTFAVSCNEAGDTNIFAGTYKGVFLSTNNGTSWAEVNNGLPFENLYTTSYATVNTLAATGNNLFAGTNGYLYGTYRRVFLSTDNGTSWSWVDNELSGTIMTLAVIGNNLFAGTAGRGVWRRPLSEMITAVESKTELPKEFALSQNYPNPFNPTTKISWQSPVSSRQTLKIFDLLGREKATLVNEEKQAGTYEVTWNAVDMPSGVYFYQLKAGNFTATKKLLLLK